ncbi:MAG: hypothetical protein V1784_02485 [bacterium]
MDRFPSETGTEETILTLCELGLADHEAVSQYAETNLLPRLSQEGNRRSLEDSGSALPRGTTAAPHLRRFVRDRVLRLLVRAGFGQRPRVRQMMSDVIEEWSKFLQRAAKEELFVKRRGMLQPREGVLLPTSEAYDAICFYDWQSHEEETVAETVTNLFAWAEDNRWPEGLLAEEPYRDHLFRLLSKQEYLSRPERMLYELELSARLGITQKPAATCWMLEELEARQDGDGFFWFDVEGPSSLPWYFPLEKGATADDFTAEWTFRGLLIFSFLGYDV